MHKVITLYIATIAIWGTTWYAITWQLGVVDPILSVSWRFFISSLLLFLYVIWAKKEWRFSLHHHGLFIIFGCCLFGLNYVFFYQTTLSLSSGLVALIFSSIVMFNALFDYIFNKVRPSLYTYIGIIMGVAGLIMVFWGDIINFDANSQRSIAIILGVIATFFASCGNMIAANIQQKNLALLPAMAWGMLYGAIAIFILAMTQGAVVTIDMSMGYLISLLYLCVLGSIIAFFCYISLIKEIGPTRASYSAIMFPLVALLLSTFLEDYSWTWNAALGLLLASMGSLFIIHHKQKT